VWHYVALVVQVPLALLQVVLEVVGLLATFQAFAACVELAAAYVPASLEDEVWVAYATAGNDLMVTLV